MHWTPDLIQPVSDAIELTGPHGTVRLRCKSGRIVAEYTGQTLVNGSAQAYAEALCEDALRYAQSIPLPWTYDTHGQQRITHTQHFYQQTFQPQLRGIERLQHWNAIRRSTEQACKKS